MEEPFKKNKNKDFTSDCVFFNRTSSTFVYINTTHQLLISVGALCVRPQSEQHSTSCSLSAVEFQDHHHHSFHHPRHEMTNPQS